MQRKMSAIPVSGSALEAMRSTNARAYLEILVSSEKDLRRPPCAILNVG